MAKKSAQKKDPIAKPHDMDKARSACMQRLLGASQKTAAEIAGVSVRTMVEWGKCSWWIELSKECQARWLQGLAAKTRVALDRHVDEDPATARFAGERLIPELAPPKLRQELSGPNGEPLYPQSALTNTLREFWDVVERNVDPDTLATIRRECAAIQVSSPAS